jgi:hypothetical protein
MPLKGLNLCPVVAFVNRVMNVGFFNSREFFDEVQKAGVEGRCSTTDLPIMLMALGSVIFYLIKK